MAKSVLKKRGQKRKTSKETPSDESMDVSSSIEPNPKHAKLNSSEIPSTISSDAGESGYSSQRTSSQEEVIEIKDADDDVKVIDTVNVESSQDDISIVFKDAEIAARYKQYFYKYAKLYPGFDVYEKSDGLCLGISVVRELMEGDDVTFIDEAGMEEQNKRKRKRKKKKDDVFVVDTNPYVKSKESGSTKYCSKFSVVEEKEEVELEEGKPEMSCFNCNGNHSIRDCKEPKNFAKIRAAKMKKKKSTAVRYHVDEEQVYANIQPGKISNELRKALGLHKNDLPPYVYKMRKLGYPPGWIEEAYMEHSELNMYDIEGRDVANKNVVKTGIDPDKIVEYPGFNAPMEKGTYDAYRNHGVPPYSLDHSKQAMLEYIRKQEEKTSDNHEVCNMDIYTDDEPETTTEKNDCTPSRESPSLTELESQKQQLLAELTEKQTGEPETPLKPPVVKTSSFGTPILKTTTLYNKLPESDNFSQNISPVINFENLPNSTGKYEQLSGVLQKVRSTMKEMQNRAQS